MALPASGTMTGEQIRAEVGGTYPFSLTSAAVQTLAGKGLPLNLPADLYGKSAYTPMNVTGNNADNSFNSASSGGTASTNPSVSVTGGNPSKTFLWTLTSNPNGFTLSNATSQTCTVSKAFTQNSNFIQGCTLQCAVNDGSNTVTATGITGTLEVSNGA